MVKYARKLVRNVESSGYESESVDSYGTLDRDGGKIQELNDVKIRLDRVEAFLKDIAQVCHSLFEGMLVLTNLLRNILSLSDDHRLYLHDSPNQCPPHL